MVLDISPTHHTILKRTVVVDATTTTNSSNNNISRSSKKHEDDAVEELRFAFLGCEDKPPYGPYEHTANLFLDLISNSLHQLLLQQQLSSSSPNKEKELTATSTASATTTSTCWNISVTIYKCKEMDYPKTQSEWDIYNGFILPGSFNSAYENLEWINKLQDIIQTELVQNTRSTLGVCFGHQLYAHSFIDGGAIKCQGGPQAGRKSSIVTNVGCNILGIKQQQQQQTEQQENEEGKMQQQQQDSTSTTKTIDLFYTHGDMVDRIPKEAICLFGNDVVPIQSVAYFKSIDDIQTFQKQTITTTTNEDDSNSNNNIPKPIAITFQAHPEYSSCSRSSSSSSSSNHHRLEEYCSNIRNEGQENTTTYNNNNKVDETLCNVMDAMMNIGQLSTDDRRIAEKDIKSTYDCVQKQSLNLMISVGQQLGWFPTTIITSTTTSTK